MKLDKTAKTDGTSAIDFNNVSWPSSIESHEFNTFLDEIETIMNFKPSDSQDGVDINYNEIQRQNNELQDLFDKNIDNDLNGVLRNYILSQQEYITGGLTEKSIIGFEAYPKFNQLSIMATKGLQPFCKFDFTPNRGIGDFKRESQLHRLRHTIAQHVRKLQDKRQCLVIEENKIKGMKDLHVSALHVAHKEADCKGRPCTDASHSGLNEGTDMERLTAHLGEFKLPQLRSLARMLQKAQERNHSLLHKTDVSSAFNCMLLSPEAAMLQAFQVGDFIIIPLVAGFGWSAAPAYYNVIADCIDWAHNGGISRKQLNLWIKIQGGQVKRIYDHDLSKRSITYVDDSCGHSSLISVVIDMLDFKAIILQLLGPNAYNFKKTEGTRLRTNHHRLEM